MQTNQRLFTDRPIHANLPDDDATGSLLETLTNAALMLILVGALFFSAQAAATVAPGAGSSPAATVAEIVPTPVPVVRSL